MFAKSTIAVCVSLLAIAGVIGKALAEDTFRAVADPATLQWVDTGEPFANTQIVVVDGDPSAAAPFILRFRCPDNYKIAAHTHPAAEAVTVLEGTFYAGMGDKYDASQLTAVRRAGWFTIPAEAAHFGLCKGTTVLEIHATGPWGTKMLKFQ